MKLKAWWTVLLFSCSGFAQSSAKASPGETVFKAKCVLCHGSDGAGNTNLGKQLKVPDLGSEEVQKRSDAELKQVISEGKNNMPAFAGQLSGAEIDQVVTFIRKLGRKNE